MRITILLLALTLALSAPLLAQRSIQFTPPDLDVLLARDRGDDTRKLDASLRTLSTLFDGRKGSSLLTPDKLPQFYGVRMSSGVPVAPVIVRVADRAQLQRVEEVLGSMNVSVGSSVGTMIFAEAPLGTLRTMDGMPEIVSVSLIQPKQIPDPRATRQGLEIGKGLGSRGPAALMNEFDPKGATGKGVIIAIIDTGIDWQHADFTRPDGTSRILYLYDVFDDSWNESKGATGTKPPLYSGKQPIGTLYTNEQINGALQGKGSIFSEDDHGHGTACAGTAAGNGRATANNVPSGTYKGVAPEADLIVVRIGRGRYGQIKSEYGARALPWIIERAKEAGKPCVVSMSYGGHMGPHDGSTDEERMIDSLTGAGIPGVAVCISAGNQGGESFHAGGRFGAKRPGQADNYSGLIKAYVEPSNGMSLLNAYFDARDDFGLMFTCETPANDFLHNNVQVCVTVGKITTAKGSKVGVGFTDVSGAPLKNVPQALKDLYEGGTGIVTRKVHDSLYEVTVELPEGVTYLSAFGSSQNVHSGRFDLYLLGPASFTQGVEQNAMVGSPGNAMNAITVGSYDFRSSWRNLRGTETHYNIPEGGISSYSSPGFRRDGRIKPDIAAPGQFTISSLSRMLDRSIAPMGLTLANGKAVADSAMITPDGYHIAWNGTSASTPYTAGVIALMLEKNPTLDAAEIKRILASTATADGITIGIPNPLWGYGRINPMVAVMTAARLHEEQPQSTK